MLQVKKLSEPSNNRSFTILFGYHNSNIKKQVKLIIN
jgi:hypothetical protein